MNPLGTVKPTGMTSLCASAAQAAVRLQSELNAAKPQSPTSVLPTADLLDTTYHSFYGLAEAYPELYQQAAVAGKCRCYLPSYNGTLVSGQLLCWHKPIVITDTSHCTV